MTQWIRSLSVSKVEYHSAHSMGLSSAESIMKWIAVSKLTVTVGEVDTLDVSIIMTHGSILDQIKLNSSFIKTFQLSKKIFSIVLDK